MHRLLCFQRKIAQPYQPDFMVKKTNYMERVASLVAAIILLQTLYFKFSAAPESVYIFSQLGLEPIGRIGTGVLELIAGSLLIYRPTSMYGAILGFGIIMGAVFSHIFLLGIQVQGDGGKLFFLAVLVLAGCLVSLYAQRTQVRHLLQSLLSKKV
jgi:hypothetical protein